MWTKDPEAERTSNLDSYLSDPAVRRRSWKNRLEHPAWSARPNAGHLALVELERQGRLVALLTQNIDELHQRAGSDPSLVVELHGTMRRVVCWTCGERQPMEVALERVRAGEEDPPCERCGGILKSDTISFGQALDPLVLERAEKAALDCELLMAVGSTLRVHPAAGYVPLAKGNGARVVIINAEATPYDHIADAVLRRPISDVLPSLVTL